MKKDIILAGVGGQGILSIAAVIGMAAIDSGLQIKQAEVHGMSQRGGDVHSNLRISDKEIYSDLIPFGTADLIISVEPMEALRYLPWLSKEGWLITNNVPHINIPDYPPVEDLFKAIEAVQFHVMLDADQMARDLGFPKAANMVILGAASPWLEIKYEALENSISKIFRSKGAETISQNHEAMAIGRKYAEKHHS